MRPDLILQKQNVSLNKDFFPTEKEQIDNVHLNFKFELLSFKDSIIFIFFDKDIKFIHEINIPCVK